MHEVCHRRNAVIEEIAVFLAKNGPEVTKILKGIKPVPFPCPSRPIKKDFGQTGSIRTQGKKAGQAGQGEERIASITDAGYFVNELANAYDRMLDAAADIAALIESSWHRRGRTGAGRADHLSGQKRTGGQRNPQRRERGARQVSMIICEPTQRDFSKRLFPAPQGEKTGSCRCIVFGRRAFELYNRKNRRHRTRADALRRHGTGYGKNPRLFIAPSMKKIRHLG